MTYEEFIARTVEPDIEVSFTQLLDGETPIMSGKDLYCGTEWMDKMKVGEWPDEVMRLPEPLRVHEVVTCLYGDPEVSFVPPTKGVPVFEPALLKMFDDIFDEMTKKTAVPPYLLGIGSD